VKQEPTPGVLASVTSPRRTGVRLFEYLEDRLCAVGRDARTGVADLDHKPLGLARVRIQSGGYFHEPAFSELDRVAGQVVDDLAQALGVGDHRARQVGIAAPGDLHAGLCAPGEQGCGVAQKTVEIDGLGVERDPARFHPREIQQVVQQAKHIARGPTGDGDDFALVVRHRPSRQQFERPRDRGHWGAQLVADLRQERRFSGIGLFRGLARGNQLRFGSPPLVLQQQQEAQTRASDRVGQGELDPDRLQDRTGFFQAEHHNGEAKRHHRQQAADAQNQGVEAVRAPAQFP
jgi:hypothetical protein